LRGQEEMWKIIIYNKKANAWRSGGVEEPRGNVRGTMEPKNKGEKQPRSNGRGGTKWP
jgi:hypothetical protein